MVAFSRMSGGIRIFLRMRLTKTLRCALTFSRIVQSIVVFFRTVSTKSRAIVRRVSSPITLTRYRSFLGRRKTQPSSSVRRSFCPRAADSRICFASPISSSIT
jgi:hypothetical protein